MNTAYFAITGITVIALLLVSIPDYIPAGFVLKTSGEVGVPRSWLPWLGTAKLVGAAGLLVGLAQAAMPTTALSSAAGHVAVAAGGCLVLFFIGAMVFHFRSRVFYNIYFPLGYLVLSTASLVVAITR
jgi:hypothetical protein